MRWLKCLVIALSLFSIVPVLNAELIAPVAIVAPDELQDVQVPIPKNQRCPNISGNCCVWASIQCLALYHHIEAAYNLTRDHHNATGEVEVRRVLDSLRVNYLMQHQGNHDKQFLIDACAKGWGAGVGLNGIHMVNIVHFKDGVVKIIDNSDSSLKIQTWTESRFMQRWDGWAISLVPIQPIPPKTPEPLQLEPKSPSTIN